MLYILINYLVGTYLPTLLFCNSVFTKTYTKERIAHYGYLASSNNVLMKNVKLIISGISLISLNSTPPPLPEKTLK